MTTLYPWQTKLRDRLLQNRSQLPHAILFYGSHGTGLDDFVITLAKDLLCEQPNEHGHACGQCASCHWFDVGTNPDFRLLVPDAMRSQYALAEVDAEDAPVPSEEGGTSKKKALSPRIRIEQTRTLGDFVNITTHSGGLRVIVVYPAERMNVEAANALLKTLEEPPPHTIFLLATTHYDILLPTIRSRCMKIPLPMPTYDQSLAWLTTQGVDEPEARLAENGGAPLLAVADDAKQVRQEMYLLIEALAKPQAEKLLTTAEKLQRINRENLIDWYERWLYDLQAFVFAGRIRYFVKFEKEIANLAKYVDTSRLQTVIKETIDRRRYAQHPLVANIALEDMLLEYRTIFKRPTAK